jgi:hypothetical protein
LSAVARYALSFLAALLLAALLLPPLLRIASPLAESWAEGAEAVVRYLSETARDESARPQDAR